VAGARRGPGRAGRGGEGEIKGRRGKEERMEPEVGVRACLPLVHLFVLTFHGGAHRPLTYFIAQQFSL
jgi:hypothetical protein